MQTFHKIAGMTETSPQPIPEPPPIPQGSEADNTDANSTRSARVSLPLNRRASHKSFRSVKSGRSQKSGRPSPAHAPADYPPSPLPPSQQQASRPSQDSAEGGEDFAWGPTHPCFPHPNPHCAPDSEEFHATRVIRVRRDWLQAGDLYPQYANLYPEILDPLVTDEEFRFLIGNINARLKAIFNPYATRAGMDAVMGVVTGFVWDDLGLTGVKKGMRELERFVEEWNEKTRRDGREVTLVQLRRTGFMALDFVVPDPGMVVVEGDGEVAGEGIGPAE